MASVAAAETASQRTPAVICGQAPPVSEGTITSSAPRMPTPPGGASNTPPARPPSVGSPARRTTHPAPADSSNDSAGNPQRRVPPARGVAPRNEGRRQVVVALLGYNATVLIGIIPELGRVGGWNTAPQVAYGVLAMAAAVLLPTAFMAAVMNHPSVSVFCAKLGAIVCSDLLIVAISTRFGRWGCVVAGPSAAAVTCIMAAMWIRGSDHGVGNAISASWGRIVLLFTPPEPGGNKTDMAVAGRQPVTNDSPTALRGEV